MTRSTPQNLVNPPSPPKSDKAKVILAGALEAFTHHGFAAASMDKIAKAAGVSKPTLYSYFKDKEGLFLALVQQLTEKNRQILFNLPMEPDAQHPPEKVLRHMATRVLAEASHNRPLLTVMRLMIGTSGKFPNLARTFVREFQKPLFEQLSTYLAAQPQLNLPDPTVAARIFAGSLVHYLIIQKILHGDDIIPLEEDRMIDGLIAMITASQTSDSIEKQDQQLTP